MTGPKVERENAGNVILLKGTITEGAHTFAMRVGNLLQSAVALALVRVGISDKAGLADYGRALAGALSTDPKAREDAIEFVIALMASEPDERKLLARSLETMLRPKTRAPGPGRPRKQPVEAV